MKFAFSASLTYQINNHPYQGQYEGCTISGIKCLIRLGYCLANRVAPVSLDQVLRIPGVFTRIDHPEILSYISKITGLRREGKSASLGTCCFACWVADKPERVESLCQFDLVFLIFLFSSVIRLSRSWLESLFHPQTRFEARTTLQLVIVIYSSHTSPLNTSDQCSYWAVLNFRPRQFWRPSMGAILRLSNQVLRAGQSWGDPKFLSSKIYPV